MMSLVWECADLDPVPAHARNSLHSTSRDVGSRSPTYKLHAKHSEHTHTGLRHPAYRQHAIDGKDLVFRNSRHRLPVRNSQVVSTV